MHANAVWKFSFHTDFLLIFDTNLVNQEYFYVLGIDKQTEKQEKNILLKVIGLFLTPNTCTQEKVVYFDKW